MTEGSAPPPPLVSVIVPHYEDLERLGHCLSALEAQVGAPPFEIVVADNASPCGSDAVERVLAGRARLTIATDKGAGPTRNAGVAVARGTILAFTDSDCVPEPGWLAAGVAALQTADFVGGAMVVLVRDERRMTGAEAFERIFAFNNRRYVEELGFTVTANLFCPRTLFDRVGGFRNGVSEDLEWCRRATSAGYRIGYAERAVVGHPARRDWKELVRKWSRINAETYALNATGTGARVRWALRTLALPLSIVGHAPRVLRSRAIGGLGNRVRAMLTLVRLRLWRVVDSFKLLFRGGS